ncbi:chitinase [Stachybotrys elegans]|uniref:chitinase n=1 Tax=Stachybotrys elegans TaxID=80388 RepID=A0A8K0SU42_9HYPO|nr:chitinase [Stachybotrys elegans]
MPFFGRVSPLVGTILSVLPLALAGFDPSSTSNIAVYWGQNSFGQGSGSLAQQRLAYYCANTDVDIIPLAFMNGITPPITNFANAGDNCTAFPSDRNVLNCPQIAEDIRVCQSLGKTIILSLAGATYTQGGWSSADAARSAADLVWNMFGPVNPSSSALRPFGTAVVDGIDFDFEAFTSNIVAFGQRLRQLMDNAMASGSKRFWLAAAPQCFWPDAANGPALDGAVFFDFIMIQFYNNWCGVNNFVEGSQSQNAFNFDVWANWARTRSLNPDVKLLLGIPANAGAGGGYTSGSKLAAAIRWSMAFESFGGVMMWDMSQMYANSGFLAQVVTALGQTPGNPPSDPGTPPPSGPLVPHWGQCGGEGYTGPTQCEPPYTCQGTQWWKSCV